MLSANFKPKRTSAASRGFLATARLSCLKTEPNLTDLEIQKPKTRFPQFGFQKPTSAVWGRFFTWFHSQFILQHDTISSQSIFLYAVSLHF